MAISVSNVLSKGTGAAALFFIVRDAHVWGKIKSDEYVKTKNAAAAAHYLDNSMLLGKPSITKSKIKDKVLRFELAENVRGFLNSGRGYFKGFFESFGYNILPLALSVGTFMKNKFIRGGSAIGLVALGAISFIKDGLGVGKPKGLTLPTE